MVWFVLMDFLGLAGGFVGAVGIFLMVATAALFIFALRSQHRVSLDETGFLLGRGQKEKKETFIPWYELAKDEKTLKKENLMG